MVACISRLILAIFVVFLLGSCTKIEQKLEYQKLNFSQIQGWEADDHSASLEQFRVACNKIAANKKPLLKKYNSQKNTNDLKRVCLKLDNNNNQNPKYFFEQNFDPVLVINDGSKLGLFTGYFEPVLKASKFKRDKYIYPIYSPPKYFDKNEKFFTRELIELGALTNQNLELYYTDDPVGLFFLHIQGSGMLELENGKKVRIKYAGKNNQNYYAIGKYFVKNKIMKKGDINAESIKKWLYSNPDLAYEVFYENPSYVFFENNIHLETIGGQGSFLRAERSLAIDKEYYEYGLPIWLDVNMQTNPNIKKLLIAQDTGGAIKGAIRGDVFYGSGQKAEKKASHAKDFGSMVVFLPK